MIFDGSRKLRALPGAIQMLREGPQVGVYAICLDADERLLPAECQAVVVVEGGRAARPAGDGRGHCPEVRPDLRAARAGAPGWPGRSRPIRDVSDER